MGMGVAIRMASNKSTRLSGCHALVPESRETTCISKRLRATGSCGRHSAALAASDIVVAIFRGWEGAMSSTPCSLCCPHTCCPNGTRDRGRGTGGHDKVDILRQIYENRAACHGLLCGTENTNNRTSQSSHYIPDCACGKLARCYS